MGALLCGCTRQEEVRHPVALDVARDAGAKLVAGASKVPVRDEEGHTHDASSAQLFYVWDDDGRTLYVTTCVTRRVGDESHAAPAGCIHPPPSKAEVSYLTTVPNWPAIGLGAIGVGAVIGNIGCFAAWCDDRGRTAMTVTDGVLLGVVLVGGVILFVDLMKAATRD
jgi:hypothetical protein